MSSQFGNRIRKLREEQKLLLRQIASILEMDTAQLSKIERGERHAKKDTVLKMAVILKVTEKELLTLWLADQICDVVRDDENALQAIMVAEDSVKYETKKNKKRDDR
jgi:transcriptional regulator with XRE-family HTH domain